MQISNNPQSQNFGMALKINKFARGSLKTLPLETVEKLAKAGEELKDTKFFHVKIDKDLSARLESDEKAYFGLFRGEKYSARRYGTCKMDGKLLPDERVIMINTAPQTEIAGVARYVPHGEKTPVYSAWGMAPYNRVEDVPALTKLAKILDDVAVAKYEETAKKQALEAAERNRVAQVVDNLIDSFGE